MSNSRNKTNNRRNEANNKSKNIKGSNYRPRNKGVKATKLDNVKANEEAVSNKKDDINDSSFYYTNEDLKRQLTDYTLTGFLGTRISIGSWREDASEANKITMYMGTPSMMRLLINPSLETERMRGLLGYQDVKSLGLTKVGLKNFYVLSANNAKTTNYQPNDVTMLIIALGQIAAYVGYVKRIFGSAFKYNVRNRDLPNELITGNHVNYADFSRNMANYRIRFNTILNSLNRLPIPGNVAYIAKWGSMYSNYYLDEYNNDLAQWYMLVPYSFWKFNETKSDTGSGFDTVVINDNSNMSDILTKLEEMIDAVINSSTFHYIFSDILRLNEKGGFPVMGFNMSLEGEDAPELYSEEFNLWVDNAEIAGIPLDSPAETTATVKNDVFNDVATGTIVYNPYFTFQKGKLTTLANFKTGTPDVEQKIAATRLKHINSWLLSGPVNEMGIACSDCYVVAVQILADAPWSNRRQWGDINYYTNAFDVTNMNGNDIQKLGFISQFNYAPKIGLFNTDDTDYRNASLAGVLDFFTTIPTQVLYEMWDAEWLGLVEMR